MSRKRHLAFFKFNGVGQAYVYANEFTQRGHTVYEISPLAGESQLIIESPDFDKLKGDSTDVMKLALLKPTKSVIVNSVQERLLKAYHSQELADPQTSLTIVESDFIGDLFFAANLLPAQVQICDLRCLRAPGVSSYLIVSGDVSGQVQDWNRQGLMVSHIAKLNSAVQALFKY